MARVLVTGATGYLGKRLVPRLLAGGHEVRALVRDPSTAAQPAGVEVMQGDLTDALSLQRAAAGEDVVVNLASITADRKPPKGGYEVVNADGVASLARAAAAADASKIIHVGGIDTGRADPGPYLVGRRKGDDAVRSSGVPWAILQPSIMFGGPDSAFVKALAGLLRFAPVMPVPGDGKVLLQMTYVGDVARCLVALVEDEDKQGRAFPIGGPDQLPYDTVLDLIGEGIGKQHVRKLHTPLSLMKLQAAAMQVLPTPPLTPAALELFADDNVAAPDAIPATFGFEPRSFPEHVRAHGLFAE